MKSKFDTETIKKLKNLNNNLTQVTMPVTQTVWDIEGQLSDRTLNDQDWMNDKELDCALIFTWKNKSNSNKPNVAYLVQEFYFDMKNYQEWDSYAGWHNDLYNLGDSYPVSGRHCQWFHALYDHTYGQNRATWQKLSQLNGVFLDMESAYQADISINDIHFEPTKRDIKLFDQMQSYRNRSYLKLRKINKILTDYEPLILAELVKQHQLCEQALADENNSMFNYEIDLSIFGSVPEQNDYYTDENWGEIFLFDQPIVQASDRLPKITLPFGDGQNHNPKQEARRIRDYNCYLYERMLRCIMVSDDIFADLERIVITITVRRQIWVIKDGITDEQPTISFRMPAIE